MQTVLAFERHRMVQEQIARRGLRSPRLLAAFAQVPRHLFVRAEDRELAYTDGALPIGYGQTISQPYIVALMTDRLDLTGGEKVLEVGTGSGYQAAILSCMAGVVHTIEFQAALAEQCKLTLATYENIHCHEGDGSLGWPDAAPYDAIIVTAAAPKVPQPLLDQVKDEGRLVLPVGWAGNQMLEVWTRHGQEFTHVVETGVAFVLLRGRHGW
jgi:protein-L-isoaspartate(D-aspartate) O-methyltransferase